MSAYVSAFELFSIGVGPSSSHTVGPLRAARTFVERLRASGRLSSVDRVGCILYGSLGATGIGHGTPDAVVAGLQGHAPETVDPDVVRGAWSGWVDGSPLLLDGVQPVSFSRQDVAFEPRTRLPGHPNAMTLSARDAAGELVFTETYFSVGGGFIRRDGDDDARGDAATPWPYRFDSARELLALCEREQLSIAGLARRNEEALRPEADVAAGLDAIWEAMTGCVEAGLHADGTLPGMLRVRRRAGAMRAQLEAAESAGGRELPGEWLGAFALAVNEENASGGRVVTAPTNGAAGILPAVAMYWWRFAAESLLAPEDLDRRRGIRRFLLTATALGSLFKANASISGAEGGCQAEVGSACAMAAGGLTAVMGGDNAQIENAAEIAMEHHLGLTCDPVGGLVQIPCIERNAIAASTAVTAARLALRGDGTHYVSLDAVVETMRQTGIDMSHKYKETSEGGLAVNVVEC